MALKEKELFEKWKNDQSILKEYRDELKAINDEKEIEDRFYKELDFGTAGLRGILGAGTNRMNEHTVGKATEGLSRFLTKKFKKAKIAIAYDSRIKSKEFAEITARTLATHGHGVYLFESLRPVPLLSFTVRELKCDAGVVITASHNPKEYNGYKVYSSYGGQVTDEEANAILDEINLIKSYDEIKVLGLEEAINQGLITIIGEEIDEKYNNSIKTLTIREEMVKSKAKDIKIIYTPLHGSGNKPVRRILSSLGYEKVIVVKEQEEADGNFPTVSYPNPESPKVFELALRLDEIENADLIFATDPDADRLGVIVKDDEGKARVLTGNQTGMLLSHYILMSLKEEGKLPENGLIVKTIVSTESVRMIAERYNIKLMDVLTGFKYIGEKMEEYDKSKEYNFLFGFEESYGYCIGNFVRDKDAVVTSMMVCEMALYYKGKGMTLYDALNKVYEEYGYFKEETISYTKSGKEGSEKIKASMDFFRDLKIKEVNGVKVLRKLDYKKSEDLDLISGDIEKIKLPSSNVIKFILEDDSWFVLRPSGTEPKMKAYIAVKGTSDLDGQNKLEAFKNYVDDLVNESFK